MLSSLVVDFFTLIFLQFTRLSLAATNEVCQAGCHSCPGKSSQRVVHAARSCYKSALRKADSERLRARERDSHAMRCIPQEYSIQYLNVGLYGTPAQLRSLRSVSCLNQPILCTRPTSSRPTSTTKNYILPACHTFYSVSRHSL